MNTNGTSFTPLLTTRDWNAEWMELQKARRKADVAAFWNKKSATFGSKDAPSHYVTEFLRLVDLRPSETVFDMGCGNGALAIPFAQDGHFVLACDFSQGMLDSLALTRAEKGLEGKIQTKLMSWEDDWETFGITPKSTDVAIASRSIATSNLKDSLMRLNAVARRKVAITLTTGASPRSDERVLTALGLQNNIGRDYLYAFNILAQEGLSPSINYIKSTREDCFDSFEDAYASLSRMVEDVSASLSQQDKQAALERLEAWLQNDLEPFEDNGRKRLRLSKPRTVMWALISWETN